MYNRKTGLYDRPPGSGIWDHLKGQWVSSGRLSQLGFNDGRRGSLPNPELADDENYDWGYSEGKEIFDKELPKRQE